MEREVCENSHSMSAYSLLKMAHFHVLSAAE